MASVGNTRLPAEYPLPEPTDPGNKVSRVARAITEAAQMPKKTDKKVDKQAKAERDYWNSMITRAEARDLMTGALAQHDEKLRMLFVTVSTVIGAIKDKGICTQAELDAYAKPVIEQLYGPLPVKPEGPKEEDVE